MTTHCHNGDFGLQGLNLMVAGLAMAFVLTGCGAARTRGATTTGLSGLEVFGGKTGATDTTPLFAGKDNKVCNCWTTSDNGGAWTTSISYAGRPGIGSSGVSVTGGKWFWQQANDVIHFGKVTEGRGQVARFRRCRSWMWQRSRQCQPFAHGLVRKGLSGVDDTHLDPRAEPFVFPPKLWGTLSLKRN